MWVILVKKFDWDNGGHPSSSPSFKGNHANILTQLKNSSLRCPLHFFVHFVVGSVVISLDE